MNNIKKSFARKYALTKCNNLNLDKNSIYFLLVNAVVAGMSSKNGKSDARKYALHVCNELNLDKNTTYYNIVNAFIAGLNYGK